jgi:hypothetical protein
MLFYHLISTKQGTGFNDSWDYFTLDDLKTSIIEYSKDEGHKPLFIKQRGNP